jgi:cytidylate kinase
MNKKHIIALSGQLASGKGTVSKILMSDLSYGVYRNGEYVRGLAKELGIDINEMNAYLEKHPEIDRDIESSAARYAKDNDNFIIDARLGWYAVPNSFKVYLTVDIDEAAKRAFNDENRKATEEFSSVEEQKVAIKKRRESENSRYLELYGVNQDDFNNYDLVIDTTNKTPEEVATVIEREYKKWLGEE